MEGLFNALDGHRRLSIATDGHRKKRTKKMTETDIIKTLEETGALLSGHFELRSGLHSNRFFQCANVLRYPRIAGQLCDELVRRMNNALGESSNETNKTNKNIRVNSCHSMTGPNSGHSMIDGVISPALGGILVGHEVARALDVKCIFAEKQDGILVMRRFTMKPGERYVVAEDVITRGGRVQETINLVKAAGAEVAAVLVLIDRSAGQASFDYPTFSLLKMAPEVWEPAVCPLCAEKVPFVHPGS
jgi:orotate phosphoribosyltransferase